MPKGFLFGIGGGGADKFQEKTANPSTELQNIVCDEGFDGLSKVIINPMKLQQKSVIRNGVVTPDEGFDGLKSVSVEVDTTQTGSGEYWVRVIDYDGSVIQETFGDTGSFIELPTPPSHEGLVFDGWSSSQPIENNSGFTINGNNIAVGATYVTDDEKTRLYINIEEEELLNVTLNAYQSVAGGLQIDWGDGSEVSSLSATGKATFTHTYASLGSYLITVSVLDNTGTYYLGWSASSGGVFGNPSAKSIINQRILTAVNYGRNISTVGSYTFSNCYNLATISMPSNLKVGTESFYNCYLLSGLVLPVTTDTAISKNLVSNCQNLKNIVFHYNFTSSANSICQYTYSLEKIALPYQFKKIGEYDFNGCAKLKEVIMPSTLTDIGRNAFYMCGGLEKTTMPASLLTIGEYSFFNCYNLNDFQLPPNLTKIGDYVFYACSELTSVQIPSGVQIVGNYAFGSCNGLRSITFNEGLTKIGSYCLQNSLNLQEQVIPESLTELSSMNENNYVLRMITAPPNIKAMNAPCNGMKSLIALDLTRVKKCPTFTLSNIMTSGTNSNAKIWVSGKQYYYYKTTNGWQNSSQAQNRLACKVTAFEDILNKTILPNETHEFGISYGTESGNEPTFAFSITGDQIVTTAIVSQVNNLLTFRIISGSAVGSCTLTLTMTDGEEVVSQDFGVVVTDTMPSVTVSFEQLTAYGFELTEDGYYTSTNQGRHSTVCADKVFFNTTALAFYNLYVDCINSGQNYYDYGCVSKFDTPIALEYGTVDDSSLLTCTYRTSPTGSGSHLVGVLGATEQWVIIKYVKNYSTSLNNDCFKVKFRLERNTDSLVTET